MRFLIKWLRKCGLRCQSISLNCVRQSQLQDKLAAELTTLYLCEQLHVSRPIDLHLAQIETQFSQLPTFLQKRQTLQPQHASQEQVAEKKFQRAMDVDLRNRLHIGEMKKKYQRSRNPFRVYRYHVFKPMFADRDLPKLLRKHLWLTKRYNAPMEQKQKTFTPFIIKTFLLKQSPLKLCLREYALLETTKPESQQQFNNTAEQRLADVMLLSVRTSRQILKQNPQFSRQLSITNQIKRTFVRLKNK